MIHQRVDIKMGFALLLFLLLPLSLSARLSESQALEIQRACMNSFKAEVKHDRLAICQCIARNHRRLLGPEDYEAILKIYQVTEESEEIDEEEVLMQDNPVLENFDIEIAEGCVLNPDFEPKD